MVITCDIQSKRILEIISTYFKLLIRSGIKFMLKFIADCEQALKKKQLSQKHRWKNARQMWLKIHFLFSLCKESFQGHFYPSIHAVQSSSAQQRHPKQKAKHGQQSKTGTVSCLFLLFLRSLFPCLSTISTVLAGPVDIVDTVWIGISMILLIIGNKNREFTVLWYLDVVSYNL